MLSYFYAASAGLLMVSSSLYWPAVSGLLLLQSWNDALADDSARAATCSSSWRPTPTADERLLTSVFPNGVDLE